MVVTTAVQKTVLDENNNVCGVQAVHTENRRWGQQDEGTVRSEG